MNSIRFILIISIAFFSMSLNSMHRSDFDFEKAWKEVQETLEKGLPKTALELVENIYVKAQSENNDKQTVKAIVFKSSLILNTEELGLEKVVDDLEKAINKASFPVKEILYSYSAELINQYFRSQYYNISNRTDLLDYKPEDIRTWAPNQYRAYIAQQYLNSVSNEELKSIEISTVDDLITNFKETQQKIRPYLYDLLVDRALEYFSSSNAMGMVPDFKLNGGEELLFSPIQEFINIVEFKKGIDDHLDQAFRLYQSVLELHNEKGVSDALASYDLKRLEFAASITHNTQKNAWMLQALQNAEKYYQSVDYHFEFSIRMAQMYVGNGDSEKAIDQYNAILNRNPPKYIVAQCKNAIESIKQPHLSVRAEHVVPAYQDFPILLQYKHIEDIYINVFDLQDFDIRAFNQKRIETKRQWIVEQPLVRSWKVSTNELIFNHKSRETIIEALPYGNYAIVTSNKNKLNDQNASFFINMIQVSDLALTTYDLEDEKLLIVRNRRTGKPIQDAEIKIYRQQYDKKSRVYNDVFVQSLRTNIKGLAYLKDQSHQNITCQIQKDDDVQKIGMYDYVYFSSNPSKERRTTEFFTDRSIYRPGQTIFFKTLSIYYDKEGIPSVDSNQTFKVYLLDANGQEQSMVELKSNEFGSASGNFSIPKGLLTGTFYLKVNNKRHPIQVEEYKRPKFKVELEAFDEAVSLGDEVYIRGNAEALSGQAIGGAKVNYIVNRSTYYGRNWWLGIPNETILIKEGTIETNDDGSFEFTFKTEDLSQMSSRGDVFTYQVEVHVTDYAGETRSNDQNISIGKHPFYFDVSLQEEVDFSDLKGVSFYAKNYNGAAIETVASVELFEVEESDHWMKNRMWSVNDVPLVDSVEWKKRLPRFFYQPDPSKRKNKATSIWSETIDISRSGVKKNFDFLDGGKSYFIRISQVVDGDTIQKEQYFSVVNHKNGLYPISNLLFAKTNQSTYQVGDTLNFEFGTSEKELPIHYFLKKSHRVLKTGWIDANQANSFDYVISEADRGGMSLIFDYVFEDRFVSERIDVQVPWSNKDLKLSLETKRDLVLPGSQEEWIINIQGHQGDHVLAEMVASMYDASLDQFLPHDYPFSIFPNKQGSQRYRQYGFDLAQANELKYSWNKVKYEAVASPWTVPSLLRAFQYAYLAGGGPIRMRGSRSKSEVFMDGVRVEAMDEVVVTAANGIPSPPPVEEEVPEEEVQHENENDDTNNIDAQSFGPRENLKETVFFFPHLKTDEAGNVQLSFKMNEALTTWKMLVFAHTKTLAFGMLDHEVKTQKDLMITANAPRYFRNGDRIFFPATVSNMMDDRQKVEASFQLYDAITEEEVSHLFGIDSSTKTIDLEGMASDAVMWDLQVPKDWKNPLKWLVSVHGPNHSDAESNVLPVVTNQAYVTESISLAVSGNEKKEWTLETLLKNVSPHALTIEYANHPIWYAIQALPYLADYPHGCSEQLLNRFYANALAAHIAQAHPRIKAIYDQWGNADEDLLMSKLQQNEELKYAVLEETPWVREAQDETEQMKRISLLFDLNHMSEQYRQTLNQLIQSQMSNGAFSWFPGGRANIYITQYIVESLLKLDRLGLVDVNSGPISELIDQAMMYIEEETENRYVRLKERVKRSGGKMFDDHLDYLSIQYLYIKSFNSDFTSTKKLSEAYSYYFDQSKKHWLGKGLWSEAAIGLIMFRNNETVFEDIRKSLDERSFYKEDLGRYWNLGNGYNWYLLPIESHAMLISFFTESGSDKSFVDDMKVWLLKNKQTNRWKTTKATADAIYALMIDGEKKGINSWIEENEAASITLGSTELKSKNPSPGIGYIKQTFQSSEILPDYTKLTISNPNSSMGWGGVYVQYFQDMSEVEAVDGNPLEIRKELFKESYSSSGPVLSPLKKGNPLKPGDRVINRIEIKIDRDMDYVHIKDLRPGNCEPEQTLSGYQYQGSMGYYQSTRDLATHFFVDHLRKGTYVLEYAMRVVYAGDYSTGMATIQCMYAPEFSSHSKGQKISSVQQ